MLGNMLRICSEYAQNMLGMLKYAVFDTNMLGNMLLDTCKRTAVSATLDVSHTTKISDTDLIT